MHLLDHLLACQPGVVEEEADVFQIEQITPEADRIDRVVNGANYLDLLRVALLDRGAMIERNLGWCCR